MKRAFDMALSLGGLIASAPLWAVFAAAGRLIRRVADRLEPSETDRCSSYELPSWAYRKAADDSVYRWHDLRPRDDGESDD